MSEDGRVEVGPVDAFEGDEVRLVDVDGVEVGVRRVEGTFHAFRNHCPHQGGPVCEGRVSQRLSGSYVGPGERVERSLADQRILSCPLHGWSFDVETGENIADPTIRLQRFEVVVADGVVYLEG